MSRKKNTKKRKKSDRPAGEALSGDWDFLAAHHAPAPLDIVWCRFPIVEDPKNPGPKPRPALVRRVLRRADGATYLEVSYGTSNPARYSDHDLWIHNLAEMFDMGLPQATIFQLDRTVTVPWASEWFTTREDGSGPVIGALTPKYREYLKHILRR